MIPIIIIVFSYGIAVGLYEYFPYEVLNQTKKIILNEGAEEPFIASISLEKFVISSIIDIDNESDILKKREALSYLIWKSKSIPNLYPDTIDTNIIDERFNVLNNLKQIDKFSIAMVATYHPAYLLRSPKEKSKSWEDLRLVRNFLNKQA